MIQHIYRNRDEAALLFAQKLEKFKNTNAVVLAIRRGGAL